MAIAAMLRRELWESREYLRQKQEAAEKGEYFAPDFEKECYLPVLRGDIPLKAHVHGWTIFSQQSALQKNSV